MEANGAAQAAPQWIEQVLSSTTVESIQGQGQEVLEHPGSAPDEVNNAQTTEEPPSTVSPYPLRRGRRPHSVICELGSSCLKGGGDVTY